MIGGYVYRGRRIPDLVGAYLFADLCSGRILAVRGPDATTQRTLHRGKPNTVSFGELANGELVLLSLDRGVYRIRSG